MKRERDEAGNRIPRDCGDCGAKPNTLHMPGCDVERCRLCGGQAISCACNYPEDEHGELRDMTDEEDAELDLRIEAAGGRLPWTGEWPGAAECREFGIWSKFVPGRGWVQCSRNDPEATEDLSGLWYYPWDVKLGRHVAKPGSKP